MPCCPLQPWWLLCVCCRQLRTGTPREKLVKPKACWGCLTELPSARVKTDGPNMACAFPLCSAHTDELLPAAPEAAHDSARHSCSCYKIIRKETKEISTKYL
ncbi:hypothetical protein DUNSADRAFT_9231 [Dunaliella salina]|uniref:Secreted protein n=1 Tax=Dunaliella salina TaxID=3046 RepID=A0ABQ7GHX8_DUNSA|nr:hypothetical protein DUNSADRAFT_9231 [Dunaliella salina]|eukprot:KAF5834201.1 hypothetical protein DUNSADRAFT_9231 [Dunaliella salina]